MSLFNINIKKLREELNLKMEDMAAIMRMPLTRLAQIESENANLDCRSLTNLCYRHPAVNLNWLIKDEGKPLSDFKPIGRHIFKDGHQEMLDEQLSDAADYVLYEEAAISYFNELAGSGKADDYSRIETTDLNIFHFKNRYYLFVKEEDVAKEVNLQIQRCLWLVPKPLLNIYIKDSKVKKDLIRIADYYRKHYSYYGNLVTRQPWEAEQFNQYLKAHIIDEEELVELTFNEFLSEQVLSTKDRDFEDGVSVEDVSFRIFDVSS